MVCSGVSTQTDQADSRKEVNATLRFHCEGPVSHKPAALSFEVIKALEVIKSIADQLVNGELFVFRKGPPRGTGPKIAKCRWGPQISRSPVKPGERKEGKEKKKRRKGKGKK